ncbi:ANTAR domain-containing protein [Kineococcus sp. SYSU DK003]|uniref:ANTAR domain-containing protein n=1 Tax=Kineococcus sp. SYSU DK003 TaxID=3383124 RepID=UPI003D7CAA0B
MTTEPLTRPTELSELSELPGLSGLSELLRLAEHVTSWHEQPTAADVLGLVPAAALGLVGAAVHAATSTTHRGHGPLIVAASDAAARALDTVQGDLDQGPVAHTVLDEPVISVPDLTADPRWPALSRWSLTAGVRSVLVLRLTSSRHRATSLTLSSPQPDAFDARAHAIAVALARHAGAAVTALSKQEHLTLALSRRDVIGQAKGMLKERLQMTDDQAFALLTRWSQERNIKLHQLAEDMSRGGPVDV